MSRRPGPEVRPRRAIRDAFFRLGMQARPHEVVQELAGYGLAVTEDQVRAVQVELLQQTSQFQSRLAGNRPKATAHRHPIPRVFPRRG